MNLSVRGICSNKKIKLFSPVLSQIRNTYKVVSRPDINKLRNPVATPESQKGFTLSSVINQKIKLSGPITVADYMKEVLTNPAAGYYMNRDVFGERGDFITSPEVCQVFGEILGIWLVTEWAKLGSPAPVQLIELGPGRGTLLADILKVTKKIGLNKTNVSIHLVEVSPQLQMIQANQLCVEHASVESQPFHYYGETAGRIKVHWYKELSQVPREFSLTIAHEFFDALPVHKFQKTKEGWREILIDIDSSSDPKEAKYKYVLSRNETVASKLYVPSALGESKLDQLEVCPQALVLANQLANRVEEDGGIALIADYGHYGSKGDTFRAFKQHKQVDPLLNPGSSDLTADVDFSQLARAAAEAKIMGPVTQQHFLEASFVQDRLQVLLAKADDQQKENLKSGYEMLTDPKKMGELFKFMAFFPTITEEHYLKYPIVGFT